MDFSAMNLGFGKKPTPAPAESNGLLNLSKGEELDLNKVAPSLKKCIFAAGWDIASGASDDYDLDISAFLLSESGRVENIRDDVIYFNHQDGTGIKLNGDNRTGAGDGDDETIDIDFSQIPMYVKRIVFFITIFEARSRAQTFGMVKNAYVRLLDVGSGSERQICRFSLTDEYKTSTALTVAEIYRDKRNPNHWSFKAIGEGSIGDLNSLLARYR